MSDFTVPRPELPSAALHGPTHRQPHVDSEESVQYERRRVSRELDPIYHHEVSSRRSEASQASSGFPSDANLRSRNASLQHPTASRELLQRHASAVSSASTQPDVPDGGEGAGRTSVRSMPGPHWYHPITKIWSKHISITIDDGAHRDHLALERTFLGYLRTSLVLVMTGVMIAQLFRLQRTANPNPSFGFYVIGRPLSITFIGMAILVILVGAFRFWKLQNGLIRGKAYTGGWEILLIMGLSALLLIATFALVLGINIEKSLANSP